MRYAVSLLLLSWTVTAAAQPAGNSNDLVVNLYNEIQSLQNEVLTLRGMVEEQGYQLQRLQAESRDRYLDLDSRLQGIAGPGAMPPLDTPPPLANTVPANTPSATTQAPPFNQPSAPPVATSGGDSQALVLDEQETYRTALSFLLEQSKPAEAILRFQSYIDRFPQGRLFTNALYWQGEALILEQRNQEAVDVFNRLLNEYPQDAKAPGAMLKVGVAYNQMGNRSSAERTWRDLPQRFPSATAEINAAQDYLRRR